ncbi:hypothetical protein CYMTET_35462, partial [Cymbomonas tetramitiformis]
MTAESSSGMGAQGLESSFWYQAAQNGEEKLKKMNAELWSQRCLCRVCKRQADQPRKKYKEAKDDAGLALVWESLTHFLLPELISSLIPPDPHVAPFACLAEQRTRAIAWEAALAVACLFRPPVKMLEELLEKAESERAAAADKQLEEMAIEDMYPASRETHYDCAMQRFANASIPTAALDPIIEFLAFHKEFLPTVLHVGEGEYERLQFASMLDGATLLQCSCICSNLPVVKCLLAQGANPCQWSHSGEQALEMVPPCYEPKAMHGGLSKPAVCFCVSERGSEVHDCQSQEVVRELQRAVLQGQGILDLVTWLCALFMVVLSLCGQRLRWIYWTTLTASADLDSAPIPPPRRSPRRHVRQMVACRINQLRLEVRGGVSGWRREKAAIESAASETGPFAPKADSIGEVGRKRKQLLAKFLHQSAAE